MNIFLLYMACFFTALQSMDIEHVSDEKKDETIVTESPQNQRSVLAYKIWVLKNRIIDILAATSFATTFKRPKEVETIHLIDGTQSDIIREACVPNGSLYAYMSTKKTPNVYLVDLATKQILVSSQKHDNPSVNKHNNDFDHSLNRVTGLYPARHKNVIASTMHLDNNVLFHSLEGKQYTPLHLNQPKFTSYTRYAFSEDAQFFLAMYHTTNEKCIHIYDVKNNTQKPQKIVIPQDVKNPKGCMFNPADSNSILFFGDNICKVLYKKRIAKSTLSEATALENSSTTITVNNEDTYGSVQYQSDVLILDARFSLDGEFIYITMHKDNQLICEQWHYLHANFQQIILPFMGDSKKLGVRSVSASNEKVVLELRKTGDVKNSLIEFNFKKLETNIIVQEQDASCNVILDSQLMIYRKKEQSSDTIAFYNCFLSKTFIEQETPKYFRSIIGFSKDKKLWIRTKDSLINYIVYEDCLGDIETTIRMANLTQEKYVDLLNHLRIQAIDDTWYIKLLTLLPENVQEVIKKCSSRFFNREIKKEEKISLITDKEIAVERLALKEMQQRLEQVIKIPQRPNVPQVAALQIAPVNPPQPPPVTIIQKIINMISTVGSFIMAPFRWLYSWF